MCRLRSRTFRREGTALPRLGRPPNESSSGRKGLRAPGLAASQGARHQGFGGALLYSTAPEDNGNLSVMGLDRKEENGLVRYEAHGNIGNKIDVSVKPRQGLGGHGTVHHTHGKDQDERLPGVIVAAAGFDPTPVRDCTIYVHLLLRARRHSLRDRHRRGGFTRDRRWTAWAKASCCRPGMSRSEQIERIPPEIHCAIWRSRPVKHLFNPAAGRCTGPLLLHERAGQSVTFSARSGDRPDGAGPQRGKSENGMPRFFRRLAEGVFDEEDLVFRMNELYEHLNAWAGVRLRPRQRRGGRLPNGANIAAVCSSRRRFLSFILSTPWYL